VSTTRQAIIEFLQGKQNASASEISRALHMTGANARHHLGVLLEQGVVEVTGKRPARRSGRPTLCYALARRVHLHNLDGLASTLLLELLGDLTDEQKLNQFERLAHRMAGGTSTVSGALPQRLYQAVQRLNDLEYQARWEAHAVAPRLVLGHCPYAMILPEHPELCHLDRHLLQALLGTTAKQVEKLSKDSRGATYCLFLVGGSQEE